MVWEDEQLPSINIRDSQETIFANLYSCACLRVNFLADLKPLLSVLYCASTEVPLSHDSKWVGGLPDSSSVVSCGNCTIWEVNGRVSITEMPNQLPLTSNDTLSLFLLLVFINNDSIFLLKLLRLNDRLLHVSIREDLNN